MKSSHAKLAKNAKELEWPGRRRRVGVKFRGQTPEFSWDRLIRFVDDPQAGIDNNPAENAIRPIALGRKNWLFIGNERSGRAAANIMSVINTCKRAGVEPYAYLLDVIRRLPSMKTTELAPLLPPEWKRQRETPAESAAALP